MYMKAKILLCTSLQLLMSYKPKPIGVYAVENGRKSERHRLLEAYVICYHGNSSEYLFANMPTDAQFLTGFYSFYFDPTRSICL